MKKKCKQKMKIFRLFFSVFFFEIVPKFCDFVNSDDCIGKILSESIRLQTFFIQKKI